MKYYWFSFSHRGTNVGVCIVEAETKGKAHKKAIELNLFPIHDHHVCYELDNLDDDNEMEVNKLYSREEMMKLNYKSTKE
jgi:hypothetical protein